MFVAILDQVWLEFLASTSLLQTQITSKLHTAMFMQRNLVDEKKEKARPGVSMARRPPATPPTKRQRAAYELKVVQSRVADTDYIRTAHPIMFIQIDDPAADLAIDTLADRDLAMLQQIPGAWFNTKIDYNEYPIWKQVDVAMGCHEHLVCFKGDNGWYISNEVFADPEDLEVHVKIFAWCEDREPEEALPGGFHVPYHGKLCWEGVRAIDGLSFALGLQGELAIALQHEKDDAGSSDGGDEKHTASQWIGPEPEPEHRPAGSTYPTPQHGGWMPKMAAVIACYNRHDWRHLERLFDEYLQKSRALQALVERKTRR